MAERALAVGRFLALLTLVAAAGCVSWRQEGLEDRAANASLVEGYTQQATENGIIAQHTLYPYHFVPGSAQLTPLGERDLRVLAEHYRQHPGPLNVSRGGTAEDLYRQRIDAVRAGFTERGVDVARVTWVDELPGGPGMSSERVLQALEAEKSARQQKATGRSSSQNGRRPPSSPPTPQAPSTPR